MAVTACEAGAAPRHRFQKSALRTAVGQTCAVLIKILLRLNWGDEGNRCENGAAIRTNSVV
jgi:hypothetical protein